MNADFGNFGVTNPAALAGWFVGVPFSFSGNGTLTANWLQMLVVLHVQRSQEVQAQFPQLLPSATLGTGQLVVRAPGVQNPVFEANSVVGDRVRSVQGERPSASVLILRGVNNLTSLAWNGLQQPPGNWNNVVRNTYYWNGQITGLNGVPAPHLSFLATSVVQGEGCESVDASAPSGQGGAGCLMSSFLGAFVPLAAQGGGQYVPQPGNVVVGPLSIIQGARNGLVMNLLGNGPGLQQAGPEARGCVWAAWGSALDTSRAADVPESEFELCTDLAREIADKGGGLPDPRAAARVHRWLSRSMPRNVVHEGLSLWNLKRRPPNGEGPILL